MLFKQIQYFAAVAKTRHFTRAADQLFVSQSALSQQINKLESDLGLKLLNRDSHPIELTAAGREFLLYAEKTLRGVQDMERQMQKYLPIEKRTIHLGMITGLGNLNISELLNAFSTEYPDINFTITNKLTKELCPLLVSHAIDLALFAAPYNIADYNFEIMPLGKEEFVLIVPPGHPLAEKDQIPLAATRTEKHIFPTAGNVSYDIFLDQCQKAGFRPKIVSECNGPGRRIDLVRGGLGIALISPSSLRYYNCADVKVLRLTRPFYKQMVLARTKEDPVSPIALALWNYIRDRAPFP